jgi:pyruvate ferredoxin oxidoreductase alpha subunit/oxalate oxidoreductase subunit alpha
MRISGVKAVAEAVRGADVDVIASFPIRPYTGVMIELARMVAEGQLDAEFVHAEGEHAQLSIVMGASASGARVFTGSSGVGVTYAFELYSPIAGEFHPVQCMIADRTLDPPGDFGSEHTEAMSARDQGWIMGWASTPQEAYDNTLIYYRLGEDRRVMLPQFPCQDGYFISHVAGEVHLGDAEQLAEFLPPFAPERALDPAAPWLFGPQCRADQGAAIERGRAAAMRTARGIIPEIVGDFNRIFGRSYAPFLQEYMTDDAEIVFFGQGAHMETARKAVSLMRAEGLKVGVVQLRFFRPFPTAEVAALLSRFRAVAILENANSFGCADDAGPLTLDVRSALYPVSQRPLLSTFLSGLGGEVVRVTDFYAMAAGVQEAVAARGAGPRVYWLGFEPLQAGGRLS